MFAWQRLLQGRHHRQERPVRPTVTVEECYNPTAPAHQDCRELWMDLMRETACTPGRPVINMATALGKRELGRTRGRGRVTPREMRHLTHRMLPLQESSKAIYKGSRTMTMRGDMPPRGYITHYSSDGTRLTCGFQDGRIRMFDTTNNYKQIKKVTCENIRWTVTDVHMTPCQRYIAYSSITPVVQMVNISEDGHMLKTDLVLTDEHVGIWSFKFSSCGTELVAGGNNANLFVYNIEYRKSEEIETRHTNDINSVAFADESSNLIFSGSDDALIKVWDRRCLNRGHVGALVGHLEGITFVSPKGDERYLLSNGKDQTMKLWDIRKMVSQYCEPVSDGRLAQYDWDYRWMDYPGCGSNHVHPDDCSVATFRGHFVLQTLIRCYFSPIHTTGQRYAITGSQDGNVYIYDIASTKLVRKLQRHDSAIRDVTWHPYEPTVVSTSWDGQVIEWGHVKPEHPEFVLGGEQNDTSDGSGEDGLLIDELY